MYKHSGICFFMVTGWDEGRSHQICIGKASCVISTCQNRARLCTGLKCWRRAKKSTPCLIKKASRCATDRTSKTTFFIFRFLYNTKILRENHVCCYLIGSVVKIVLYLHFLDTKDGRLWQIKKKPEWWNNCFSGVFTYCLNLKYFASLFLAKDNFMF